MPQSITPDQVTSIPDTAASNDASTQQPADPQSGPPQQPLSQSPVQDTSQQSQQTGSAAGMVSNTPAQPVATPNPLAQKASWLHEAAQTMAGGPRYKVTVDPNTGETTRTQVPMSGKDIGMAIALEAISGAMAGLGAAPGPGVVGRAATSGFAQQQQAQQQMKQQQDQQAREDAQQQTAALSRSAQAYDLNARAVLNTAQAEKYGVDSLKATVVQNARLLSDYEDAGAVLRRNISQDALMAGLQDGTYSGTAQIAIPDGFTSLNGKMEQTFSVVANPSAKVPLSNAQLREFAENNVPGFASFKDGKTKISEGYMTPGNIVAQGNAQVAANKLMLQEVGDVTKALADSDTPANQELAKSIPSFKEILADRKTGPMLQDALARFQKYVSHSDQHGMDFYQSLQQMASPSKADPQNPKQFTPNRDAKFATTIAGAFGNGDPQKGWDILKAYSSEVAPLEIKSEAEAADMLASSDPGSRSYKYAQKWIASNTAQHAAIAGATERARDAAPPASPTPTAASLTSPDALGFTPTVSDAKEANKRFGSFKKNLDELGRTEQSYKQFQQALTNISAGNWTGADSVVALFNAIGLSAAPLAGRGFRINQNTIHEHETARGWEGALQAHLQGVQSGAVITPQQLKDYANIAANARTNQYVATANAMHNAGISADAALPTGNGQHIDPTTARIFLQLSGGDKDKARQAAKAKDWSF